MTAIVGLVSNGRVVMGADSLGVDGGLGAMARADQKLFRRGPYLIGFTSSFRMGQLIRYRADLPEPYEWEHDMLAFMSTRFVDAVRQCLKDYGWAKATDAREQGGAFLVGFRGALYDVESDFQVGIRAEGYDAVGSGKAYALGSLHATNEVRKMVGPSVWIGHDRVRMALEAAAAFSAGVRGPFLIEEAP